MTLRSIVRVVLMVAVLLSLTTGAEAQRPTGAIIGVAKDASGGVLPGVTVTIESPAMLGGPQTVVTSANGEYRFIQLDSGTYTLTIALEAFGTYKEDGLRVAAGGTIERNVVLNPATVAESITVHGQSPLVDARRVNVTATI